MQIGVQIIPTSRYVTSSRACKQEPFNSFCEFNITPGLDCIIKHFHCNVNASPTISHLDLQHLSLFLRMVILEAVPPRRSRSACSLNFL